MSKVKTAFDIAKKFAVTNAPTILTCAAVGGGVTTVIVACKETPKACKALETLKAAKPDNNWWDKTKTVAPIYWPAATIGALSIACAFGANSVNLKRQAAIFAAYQLSETNLKDYKESVLKTLGPKKSDEVQNKVAQEKMLKVPMDENTKVIFTGSGDSLCFDCLSGRYFRANIDKIKKAELSIKEKILSNDCVSLNDFYDEIGLDNIQLGEDVGWLTWKNGGEFDIFYSSQLTQTGEPCLTISYEVKPIINYNVSY